MIKDTLEMEQKLQNFLDNGKIVLFKYADAWHRVTEIKHDPDPECDWTYGVVKREQLSELHIWLIELIDDDIMVIEPNNLWMMPQQVG